MRIVTSVHFSFQIQLREDSENYHGHSVGENGKSKAACVCPKFNKVKLFWVLLGSEVEIRLSGYVDSLCCLLCRGLLSVILQENLTE